MTKKTADICDANEGVVSCTVQLRGFGKRRSFYGFTRTVRCDGDILGVREILNQQGNSNVLIVDNGGALDCAVFGDVMASVALRNGWAGLVINGAIRDSAEINAMEIGVKALGTTPRRGSIANLGEIDVPVNFGGVTFEPGRYVVVDDDGVVLLPKEVTEGEIAVENCILGTE